MLLFSSDYTEGAHPKILEKLVQTNYEQTQGYGEDSYCREATRLIKDKCCRQDIDVHFFIGGTQTNLTVVAAALRPHQGVISAATGHINVHESGAIEATGHKVLALPGKDGKLTASQIQEACDSHFSDATHEHMVQPKMVYISNPTEVGSIYTKAELTAISEVCRRNYLILYMDGARLGYALCAEGNDLSLPDIAELCDVFYIGGTKMGALFGEALVICNADLKTDFRYLIKQRGGMLAKGRLLGLQFIALFEDDLYLEISRHANEMAKLIKEACVKKGYYFLTPSVTNQQFPIIPGKALEKLKQKYEFSYWQRIDGQNSAVRFCTSWATEKDAVLKLAEDIERG